MSGYYTIKQSEKNSEWYFNLKAGNHEIILQSQGYSAKSGALNGIQSVQNNSGNDDHYDRRKSDAGHWFVLKAANGEIIGKSEMYTSSSAMENGISSVKTNGSSTTIKEA